jgi:hypothetical protein
MTTALSELRAASPADRCREVAQVLHYRNLTDDLARLAEAAS